MAPTVDTGGSSIAEIAGHALRYWKLALVVSGVVFVCLCALIFSLQPVYKADVLLQLPSAPVDDTRQSNAPSRAGTTDPYLVATEMDILSSDAIVRDVITKLRLVDEPSFNQKSTIGTILTAIKGTAKPAGDGQVSNWTPEELAMDRAVRFYKSGFSAYNDGRSMSAHLSFTGPDPRLAALIANTHAEIYVDLQTTRRTDAQKRVAELIAEELERRRGDLVDAETALADARIKVADGVASGTPVTDAAEIQRLSSVVSTARGSLAQTTARLADAKAALGSGILQSAQFVATDAKLVSPAAVPIDKNFPKTALFVVMAAMMSGTAGVLAALAAQVRSGRSRRIAAQLSSLGLRILGTMPKTRRSIRKRMGTTYWERIRFVRDNLLGQKRTDRGSVIVVTSALPGEGKSTVAWALARVLAASGRRTLFVDCDMRVEKTMFRRQTGTGLSDILVGSDLMSSIHESTHEGLAILERGNHPGGIDALASGRMVVLAEEMRSLYDVVVIDTPPLAVVSDAILIAEAADSTVLVASARMFRPDVAARIVGQMTDKNIVIGGAVVTGIEGDELSGISRRQMRRYSAGPVPVGVLHGVTHQ